MKTLKITTATMMAVIASLFFFGCEDSTEQEIAQHQIPVPDGGYIPPPTKGKIPFVKRIIEQDFREAKGWKIIWEGSPDSKYDVSQKIPGIFSTVTGSVNSIQYLNGSSYKNTDNADMWIYHNLRATDEISTLDYSNYTKKTSFKLSGMTVADLQDAAENNPNLFALAYEWDLNESTGSLNTGSYQEGQIFTFKTDRTPAKYGAVRIVDKSPLTVEVVVQK